MNQAIRETYADCVTWAQGDYQIMESVHCNGRLFELRDALDSAKQDRGSTI